MKHGTISREKGNKRRQKGYFLYVRFDYFFLKNRVKIRACKAIHGVLSSSRPQFIFTLSAHVEPAALHGILKLVVSDHKSVRDSSVIPGICPSMVF